MSPPGAILIKPPLLSQGRNCFSGTIGSNKFFKIAMLGSSSFIITHGKNDNENG